MNSIQTLVVEDHASTNEVLVKMLGKAGYACTAVQDAWTAVDMFRREHFELVIADIGLPDANGWELLRLLRAIRRDFRAVALSGHCYPADIEHSQEAGFDLHISKPAEWQTIEAALAGMFSAGGLREGGSPVGGLRESA